MKKIGLVTFQRSLNYGSALQVWALSNVLEKIGMDVQVLDYYPNNYDDLYALFWLPNSVSNLIADILHIMWMPFFIKRKADFSNFLEQCVRLSNVKYDPQTDITSFTDNKDVMICGSDQIWNPNAKDFDHNYFLPESRKCKKISYAVSLGNGSLYDAKEQDKIRKYLMDFAHLSMREKSAADKVDQFLGVDNTQVTLDPTLLLEQEDFLPIISKKGIDRPYIFFYSVWLHKETVSAAVELSKRYGLPVYTMISGRGNKNLLKNQRYIKLASYDAGPKGFLNMIKNAKYVITDSFHGTAFSLIFEKKFVVINYKNNEGKLRQDERIRNILDILDLSSHYVTKEEAVKYDLDDKIDYVTVTKKRLYEAEKSINWLKKAIEE